MVHVVKKQVSITRKYYNQKNIKTLICRSSKFEVLFFCVCVLFLIYFIAYFLQCVSAVFSGDTRLFFLQNSL